MENELEKLGLTTNEVKTYLFLLENGMSSAIEIARAIGIVRTNTYGILRTLSEKGLVSEKGSGKKLTYQACSPRAILNIPVRLHDLAAKILPKLDGLYHSQKNKPKVQYFEGKEGVIEAFECSLVAEEIFGFGSTEKLEEMLPDYFWKYQKELNRNKIIFRDVLTAGSRANVPKIENLLGGLYSARFLPNKYGDSPTNILMWEDSIALITLSEPMFATIITDTALAETFKMLFRIAESIAIC